jgi:DNA polymerase III subunit delta
VDYFSLVDGCDKKTLGPLVWVHGDEPYLVTRAVKKVKATVLTRAPDFNFTELDAKEHGIEKAISAAEQLPMMAERRLVIVRRAEEIKADAAERLLSYIANPSPTTVLLFVAATLDSRTKLAKSLTQAKAVYDCSRLKRPQLQMYVAKTAKEQRISVTPDVYEVLFDAYGQDLSQWLLALDRMSLYAGPGQTVDGSVAEQLVFRTRVESIFALTDALLAGDTPHVLSLCEELLQQKEAPLAMVGLCARQIRQLIVLREAIEREESPRDHLKTAGIPPFFADKYLDSARKTTLTQLKRAHAGLADADHRLKSSRLEAGLDWFASLWDVMSATAATSPARRA